jgi:hypothetical protein
MRQVAVAAKSHFRLLTVYDDPFPTQGSARFDYGWNAVKAMVKDSRNKKWQSALAGVKGDVDSQVQLVKFVL